MHFLKCKTLPLGCALLVGTLSVLPHLLASYSLGEGYLGYPFIYQANEDIYMGRIQEILDGHPLVGSPMLHEYKDAMPPVLPTSEYVYAVPAAVFNLPLPHVIVAYKFILPAVLFLLVYTLVFGIVARGRAAVWSAVGAGAAVTLGYDLVDYSHLWQLLTAPETHLLLWTRPVNPVIPALLLCFLTIVVWRTLTKESRWLWVGGGLALGALIGYVFSWLVGGALAGAALVFALYKRNVFAALRLGAMVALGFVVQIPYWYQSLSTLGDAAGRAVQLKNGAFFTHAPIINKFVLATTAVFVLCAAFELYKKRSIREFALWWWFCALLLVSCWAAFNQQIITGITVWPYHIVQFTIPLCIITLVVLGHNYVANFFPKLWGAALVLLISASLAVGVSSALSWGPRLPDFAERQTYMPIFSWLNNAPRDCVVLVSEQQENLSTLVTSFTHCDTYISTYVPFNVPQDRILHNYLSLLRLRGLQPQGLEAYLLANPLLVNGYLYSSIDQSLFGGINEETKQNIQQVVPAYAEFYRRDFGKELKKYRIDYLLDTGAYALPKDLRLKKEMETGGFTLYTIL